MMDSPISRARHPGLHPMQSSAGTFPDIHWNMTPEGKVHLSIFVRCGSNAGKWFARVTSLEVALDFLRSQGETYLKPDPEQYLKEMELFFHWEWTGGTPTLDGEKAKTSTLTLEDLGL